VLALGWPLSFWARHEGRRPPVRRLNGRFPSSAFLLPCALLRVSSCVSCRAFLGRNPTFISGLSSTRLRIKHRERVDVHTRLPAANAATLPEADVISVPPSSVPSQGFSRLRSPSPRRIRRRSQPTRTWTMQFNPLYLTRHCASVCAIPHPTLILSSSLALPPLPTRRARLTYRLSCCTYHKRHRHGAGCCGVRSSEPRTSLSPSQPRSSPVPISRRQDPQPAPATGARAIAHCHVIPRAQRDRHRKEIFSGERRYIGCSACAWVL
jgi:hypothetical protein